MQGNEEKTSKEVKALEEKIAEKQQELDKTIEKYVQIVIGFDETGVHYEPELSIMKENARELACDVAMSKLDLAVMKGKEKRHNSPG